MSGDVTSTAEWHKMLAVKFGCTCTPFFNSAVAAFAMEEEHCIFPVIELIADGTSCIPDLLLTDKLVVLEFVTLHRSLHIDACDALVAWEPCVGLLVELGNRLLDAAAATDTLLGFIV